MIPIRSWEPNRRPFVKWKEFQTNKPSRRTVEGWWNEWPDAGIAVVLGRISGLLCVDVDGEEAHQIILDLLGGVPVAPTLKSGSEDPYRYHLYFQHPEFATAASKTPWNSPDDKGKLELRGDNGLAVLPPSKHRSGRRYTWATGRSLDDLELPDLPDLLLEGLEASIKTSAKAEPGDNSPVPLTGHAHVSGDYSVAPSTSRFLAGIHADSAGWNNRLFRAACDMSARGVPHGQARTLLLQGANPKTVDDERAAIDTIAQAFKEPRKPSRY